MQVHASSCTNLCEIELCCFQCKNLVEDRRAHVSMSDVQVTLHTSFLNKFLGACHGYKT